MWNLVEFMKTLKQTFSRRVNRHHEHCGTIWDERYKLVLVEPGHAARTLSAYIDLSPVREGFVTDPRDYRWCGYAAAVTGHPGAREAIQRLVSNPDAPDPSDAPDAAGIVLTWPAAAGRYRELLSARPPDGKQKTRSRTKRTTGKLKGNPRPLIPESQALHRHVRHFEDGLVIGSAEFVENVFQWSRDHFGPKRKNGPRKIRGIDTRLRSMRDLRD